MQYSKVLFLLSCMAMGVVADDCDDDVCSSTNAAGMVVTYTKGADTSSSTLGPRESAVTVVETSYSVQTLTNTDSSVYITSLPKSLYTRTTMVAADTTLVPVLTPSVISSQSQYVVSTIMSDGKSSETTVIPTGATVVSSGSVASVSPTSSSSVSTGGVWATGVPAGLMAGAFMAVAAL